MFLMYTKISYRNCSSEGANEIMIFHGNYVDKLESELLESGGDLPSIELYDDTLRPFSITLGARYRGSISVSLTKSGNTRIVQYLGIDC